MAEDEATSPSEGRPGESIVVVDPDPVSRNLVEDLEDELEVQVVAMDSMDFDTETSEDVVDAGTFVLCWDLGIRSAGDLIEQIRRHPTLSDRRILVASARPTPSMVRWAMLLGADGFCGLPYDADEIRARLASTSAEREAA